MQTVAVIGLGYVGLPLVIEFGKHARTIGFDIVEAKVAKCREGVDPSREISNADMALAVHAEYTSDPAALREADFILIAVPTPVDDAHIPNFAPLVGALTQALPYVITLVVLATASQRLRPPAMAGVPYRPGETH